MELYFVLKIIWWLLLGVLLSGIAVMVGMDMGVGTLLRFVGKTDAERRTALNIIGPHWDGNQVWFVLGGGAVFAAFPWIYATAFSGLYVVMLLLLWSMIVRPLGFEYRSKLQSPQWRNFWDWMLLLSGFLPMLIYGAAMGNALQGFPFHFDERGMSFYTGSFITLLNPFAILTGVVAVAMSVFMGAAMLMIRGEGPLYERAKRYALRAVPVALVLFAIGGIWLAFLPGYVLTSKVDPAGPASPLIAQSVSMSAGAWYASYKAEPLLWLLPVLVYVGLGLGYLSLRTDKPRLAWWFGALAWIGTIFTVGATMFPFLMPSYTDPNHSLTLWNAVSSERTLSWMLGWTMIFTPLVVIYTSWAFYVMGGKVKPETIEHDEHAY